MIQWGWSASPPVLVMQKNANEMVMQNALCEMVMVMQKKHQKSHRTGPDPAIGLTQIKAAGQSERYYPIQLLHA